MLKKRRVLVLAIVAVIFLLALTYYVIVPGFDITESPVVVQSGYYFVLGKVGRIDLRPNSAFMKRAHEATHVTENDKKKPYTFVYTDHDVDIIEKDSRRCRACHGSMLQRSGGEPVYPIHEVMMTARLIYFHCTDCHKKVDLGPRNPSRATIRVDRTQCTRCHEDDQESEQTELMNVRSREREKIPSRYLISNHGFDKKTGKQWVARHAKVGPEIGVKKCRRCHQLNTELDICGECHGQTVAPIQAPQG